jgi:hypothetical protein
MPAPYKRCRWKPGQIFGIPLSDGSFAVAQAIAPVESYGVEMALFSARSISLPVSMPDVRRPDVISIQSVWRTILTGGWWCKLGDLPLVVRAEECPNQVLLAKNPKGTGCNISSERLVVDFLLAYHGVIPWNLHPAFDFDTYLFPGLSRPSAARELDAASLATYLEHYRRMEEQREQHARA